MDPLTLQQGQFITKRSTNQYNPIPLRWKEVVYLHMKGAPAEQIAKLTGYTENSIYRILHNKDVEVIRQELMSGYKKEFEALQKKVVEAVRKGLDDPDPKVNLIASGQWLKASEDKGKGSTNVSITAEDIVVQILNGGLVKNEY